MKKFVSRWIVLGFLLSSRAQAVGLNDVSVLLPLPQNKAEMDDLLGPNDDHELISAAVLEKLPAPIMNEEEPELRRSTFRVVGLRFDPCFAEGEPLSPCRHQIRLIFQPVSWYEGRPMTLDAAVHAFFDFDDSRWNAVIRDWRRLAVDGPTTPLQIHPRIREEGLSGPHWAALKDLIIRHCSSSNLTRVTAESTNLFGALWLFRGYDIDTQGNPVEIQIAKTGHHSTQTFFVDLRNLQEIVSEIRPAADDEPAWMAFMKSTVRARMQQSPEAIRDAVVRAVEFENPAKFNPGNRDCVSCHVAQTARLWGEENIAGLMQDSKIAAARFTSPFPLTNLSVNPFNANRVRAFGYFLDEPIFSQRVINESAAVLSQMLGQ